MAHVSALGLELRADGAEMRQRAAIEALRGLAEGLKAAAHPDPAPGSLPAIMAAIATDPAGVGTATCPDCAGRLAWIKDASNGHIHARCEDAGCFTVLQ